MKSFFKELFEYNSEMNQKLIEKLNTYSELPLKSTSLFNHILGAQHIWNHRILQYQATLSVWPDIRKADYQKTNSENHHLSDAILSDKNPEELITYTNSKGDSFSNSVKDILFHVINHSNYHRAQIASIWKEAGIDPIISDYIFFKR
jgi:uncharacterized damage-inducible protein DinB